MLCTYFWLAHTRCWSFGSFPSYVCVLGLYTCDIWYFCRRSRPLMILDVILCRSAFSFHIHIYKSAAAIPFGIFKIKMVSGRFECVFGRRISTVCSFSKKKNLNFCRCAAHNVYFRILRASRASFFASTCLLFSALFLFYCIYAE